MSACTIDGCTRRARTRGWCGTHYQRYLRHGHVEITRHFGDDRQRVLSKVARDANGCWLWTGALLDGYGIVKVGGGVRRAHRVVFEFERGPIPDGLELDHLCRVRRCVNPDHLEPVTKAENIRRERAERKGRAA